MDKRIERRAYWIGLAQGPKGEATHPSQHLSTPSYMLGKIAEWLGLPMEVTSRNDVLAVQPLARFMRQLLFLVSCVSARRANGGVTSSPI
jgi:hypothetical protein